MCVVNAGTFRKAATVLGTTQPNVSARISALEQSLDVLLMHRDAGSVRLTQKGQLLLEAARKILLATEEFIETAQRHDLIEDRMRLGVTELVASTWLHEFLRRFRAIYPAISVELDVNLSVEIERSFTAGQLDLAIMTRGGKSNESNDKPATPLGTHAYAWVCAPLLSRKLAGNSRLENLLSVSIITHAKHTVASRALAEHVKGEGLLVDGIVHSSSLSACVEMVLDGMGVALLPQVLVQKFLDDGSLVEVDYEWSPAPLEFEARFNSRSAPKFVIRAAEIAFETCADRAQ